MPRKLVDTYGGIHQRRGRMSPENNGEKEVLDLEKEIQNIAERAKKFGFFVNGVLETSLMARETLALCLRVEQAAIKAERERCAEIAQRNNQKHFGHIGDYDAGARHCSQLILSEILARNGETKNG